MLNGLLLTACICIVIASFIYFFYWNRFIAWVLGLIFRLLYWGEGSSSIWLEIGSIHFSLLTGRILLKDVRYHSSNQTLKIVKAQVAWRYWIRRPTSAEEIGLSLGEEAKPSIRTSSCRIHLSLHGFEWFLYNRTAAFDNIVSQMQAQTFGPGRNSERRASFQKSSEPNALFPSASLLAGSLRSHTPDFVKRVVTWVRSQLPKLDPKDLLPLGLEIVKGAIVCGNSSTPNLLVAEFQRSEGTFGIVRSRSKHDLYKHLLTLSFRRALVQYVENDSYCCPMTTTGEVVEKLMDRAGVKSTAPRASYPAFAKLWNSVRLYTPIMKYMSARRKASSRSIRHMRKRTKKSLDEDTPIGIDFSSFEYAMERKILEAPLLELSYYADVAGIVPQLPHQRDHITFDAFDIGNGDMGPEWGIDLVIHGGFVRYGPWADRQRAELQRAFFPPTCHDAEETRRLQPGDQRMWTAMRIFVELRDETTLHIPFRESSKNWQWDGITKDIERPRKREPALLHVTAEDRSSITYLMPMVASSQGYEPVLEVHLDTVAVTSSLNDIRLVVAESFRIHCELPTPLKWNGERLWSIVVTLRRPTLFLLRDHINMFTDLGKDWASGPPSDYQRFIPMLYKIELDLHHYDLNLYGNDHNVIDKPLIKEENAIFSLTGARLKSQTTIPSNVFRPDSTTISFTVDVPDVSLGLSLPRWNTNALHTPKDGNSLARVRTLSIKGSYEYFAEVHPENVEHLRLTFMTEDISFKCLGWSIRYFMILKDNYFGSFTHFATLYEYLDKRRKGIPPGDPVVQKYRPGKSNMMQVDMTVVVRSGLVILPAGLPGYEMGALYQESSIGHSTVLTVPYLQLQFRMHDHFMEMSLNIDTIYSCIEPDYPENLIYPNFRNKKSRDVLVIDGIDVAANRLFGPVPRTLTYVCIWEVHLGSIKASLSAFEADILEASGSAFRINFSDTLNAPAEDYATPIFPDLTFVKLSIDGIDLSWRAGNAVLQVAVPYGLSVDNNDLGGHFHHKLTSLRLPYVSIKGLLTYDQNNTWFEAAELSTDLYVDIYSSPAGWRQLAHKQAEFVREQDESTGRAKRMIELLQGCEKSACGGQTHSNGVYIPAMSLSDLNTYRRTAFQARRNSSGKSFGASAFQSSESEEEPQELFVQAVHEARAAARSQVSPKNVEDDLSIEDESDDEDLTEHSDSDWPEAEADVIEAGVSISLLKQYAPFVTHYAAYHVHDPSQWEDGPFMLNKRSEIFSSSFDRKEEGPKDDEKMPPPLILTPPDNKKDTTVYRVAQRKGLEITVTPLAVSVMAALESDIRNVVTSAERRIDSLMATHLGGVSDAKASVPQCTVLHVRLEAIKLSALQHTALPKGVSIEIDHALEKFSLVECHLDSIQIYGEVSDVHRSISSDLRSVKLECSAVSGRHRALNTSQPALSLSVSSFRVLYYTDDAEILVGAISSEMTHYFPELLMSTGLAAADQCSRLMQIYRQFRESSMDRLHSVTFHILQRSEDHTIVDPLSTIQPSFLVQVGTPQKLRTDPTFRFLYHLRNCLWHIRRSDPTWDAGLAAHVPLNDLIPLLETRLTTLDPDTHSLFRLRPVEHLLPSIKSPKIQIERPIYWRFYACVKLEQLHFTVLDATGRLACNITLEGFVSYLRVRHFDMVISGNRWLATSQSSMQPKWYRVTRKVSASVSLSTLQLAIYPPLMSFAQECLRTQRLYTNTSVPAQAGISRADESSPSNIYCVLFDVALSCRLFRLQAVAEKLTFEIGASDFQSVSTTSHHPKTEPTNTVAMNHSVITREILVKACSPSAISQLNDQDNLAFLVFSDTRLDTSLRKSEGAGSDALLAFIIGGLRLTVPRSALRLYRFVEDWRADFLPGIETTIQAFLSELEQVPVKENSTWAHSKTSPPRLHVNGRVLSFGIYLRTMHDTWLSWEVNDTIVRLLSCDTNSRGWCQALDVHLSSQIFSVFSHSQESGEHPRVRLELPSIHFSGQLEQESVHAIALIRFLELKVKPSHWDMLLAVQQKFGQDFNDLMVLIQETQSRRAAAPLPSSRTAETKTLKYSVHLKMEGFRIGFEGLSSILLLECPKIGGRLESFPGQRWSVTVTDLALSLAPRTSLQFQTALSNRRQRSAFVIIDFKVSSKSEGKDRTRTSEVLEVNVTKIHAVMQPSSIGEIGDFIDDLQVEIMDRRERRAQELAAFKQKTQRLLQTFDVKSRNRPPAHELPWLNRYTIEFAFRNIGVAFPLALDHDMDLPSTGTRDATAVRAFLFSIRSVNFGTERGETGQANMQGFSFQFVPRFRQSVPEDFCGDKHETRNRLLYPEMTAQLKSLRSATSSEVFVKATVSGFILDLDSTIPDYVFSLFDVYRKGKERMAKLTASLPRAGSSTNQSSEAENMQRRKTTHLPTSNFFASLTFLSGKVCIYSAEVSNSSRARAYSGVWDKPDQPIGDVGAEVFNLPVVSVWTEYRAVPPRQPRAGRDVEPSILMFKSTVHSSHNTLRPTLLCFVTEVMTLVETRLRTVHRPPLLAATVEDTLSAPTVPDVSASPSSLQISFSLRIDQSKLELTCHPDVNVVAGLNWDSGGFVINASPGARKVTFTGSVGGLTVGLKHGFLSEDCVQLDARNLAFSVTFAKSDVETGRTVSSISLALETEFLGGVRFSRLQDILCFKAVWLDRIPVFNGNSTALAESHGKAASSTSTTAAAKQEFTTAVLIRIRQIKLDIDLGQSISTVVLHLKNSVLRSKLTESFSELSFVVGDVAIAAKGNVAGHANVSNFVFQTIRRTENPQVDVHYDRMLELRMTSGPLIVMLESDYQKLLHYRAEPLKVEISDDWSMTLPSRQNARPLQLSFTVKSPEVVVIATVGTIPKLLSYANKFKANLEAQRAGASRESKTFRISRAPKPDNPLSAVAEAMIHSARTRFKEADPTLIYTIKQNMRLGLDHLRLVVFPRTMADAEVAQFVGRNVRGRLDRLVESEATRDIRLSFTSMKISRFTQLGHAIMPPSTEISDGRKWLDDLLKDASSADIVGLPSMKIHMTSEERRETTRRRLHYDFDSQFLRTGGLERTEDIYITLNVGLYSWLTVLRKTLAREMDQVKATAEWRTVTTSVGVTRKKVPEPLNLDDGPKSATVSRPFSPAPPLSPYTIRSPSAINVSFTLPETPAPPSRQASQAPHTADEELGTAPMSNQGESSALIYEPGNRRIERLTMKQLGDATPDVMHPFFMKKAGFSLEDSLPQYVHEYATAPLEEIMEALLNLYSKQLLAG